MLFKSKIDKNYSYIKIQKCFYKKKDVLQILTNNNKTLFSFV